MTDANRSRFADEELVEESAQDIQEGERIVRRGLIGSLLVVVVAVVAAGIGLLLANLRPTPTPPPAVAPQLPTTRQRVAEPPVVRFTDVTEEAGIDFVHRTGAEGDKLLPETMGGGCAFLDFDRDGDQDLLLVDSGGWEPPTEGPGCVVLYLNDGSGRFERASDDVVPPVTLYGMGVALGDVDGNGWTDVYITAVGRNLLLLNQEGTLVDATAQAKAAGPADAWSTSAAFFDYDRDGDLDLYFCNYVAWSREIDLAQLFTLTGEDRAYGPPLSFAGSLGVLLRNDGGTFTDVSADSGIQKLSTLGQPAAKALGLLPCDLDGDGWLDLVVANDTVPNFLFRNQQDGTFEEVGTASGLAFGPAGNARGAMGIDVGWFRNDETLGIAIGNFSNEMTALYVSQPGRMQFLDEALATGLGPPTRQALTFGLCFLDYDLDGRLDILAANGHLEEEITIVQPSQTYEQSPQLFWNAGADQPNEFELLDAEHISDDFLRPLVGRGASYADIDSDGDLDILLTSLGGKPRLLRNDQALGHHWLRVKLRGNAGNPNAIGALVTLRTRQGTQRRLVMPTRSYLSQVELPATFGLGDGGTVDAIDVRWPDGKQERFQQVGLDQGSTLEIGTGSPLGE